MSRARAVFVAIVAAASVGAAYAYHTASHVFVVFQEAFEAYSEGYTLDRVVINAYEEEGDSATFSFTPDPGVEYRVIAVGDEEVFEEPDLTVSDGSGRSVGEAEFEDNVGRLDFTAPNGGIEVEVVASSMESGLGYGGLIVLRKED